MRGRFIERAQLAAGVCLAAMAAFAPSAHAQTQAPFKPERFDETWPQGADAPFGAQFKNLHIADGTTLSLGGDARWRFSALDAPRLGLGGVDADEWLLQRLLLHADLRFGDTARVFVQLGAHDGVSREIPSPSDDGGVDLQQAFLDLNADIAGAHTTLRIGRQELALGPRYVTTRDSGNVRQRHDMVRLIATRGDWRADLFAGRPTEVLGGAFDDEPDPGEQFYGGRLQHISADTTTEFYAYELDREEVPLAGLVARDRRLSIGARAFGRRGDYDFDAEAIFQRGAFGGQDICAYGAVIDVARHFDDAPLGPKLDARVTYGSGDSDLGDGEQGTFAAAFPNGGWFGQNGLASFSNSVEAAALITLAPREDVAVTLKLSGVWRADAADFLYAGNGPLAGSSGGDAFTGVASSVSLTWRLSPNATITPYMSYVAISDDLASRGAHDVAYAHVNIALRF
jgi:hypothetical protein